MDRLKVDTAMLQDMALEPGRAWPLGAHADVDGVNFAVFSAHATAIELCLFDATGTHELARQTLPAHSADIWHGRLPGAKAGLVYGLRAHGPWQPEHGLRFNPHKLLLDPYARETVGQWDWSAAHCGHATAHPDVLCVRDNAGAALKARVVGDSFDWQGDAPLHRPLRDTLLYELHVRGFSMQNPGVPEALRGSYAGLGSPAALAHLQRLGVTAVSLLPVHQHLDEERLHHLGLSNYWGYNTLGFFCVEPRLASSHAPRDEFRQMVRSLHAEGIEVILDVVFNHTAEGDHRGPTVSWRGLCNSSYYRLNPNHPAHELNYSGCGNTLNLGHPRVLQMVLDSLRYWVQEMHVDGFRFDLAPVLGRQSDAFDNSAAFFKAVAQDPVLAGTKLIAEPWDLGPNGYQLGHFPPGWLEWNDRFRDVLRAFWLGGDCTRGELAMRLCASSDRFDKRKRAPGESVNFITAHDGFTLRDLVSYNQRHNAANGEHNHDGHSHNLSWNSGHEGPSSDPAVNTRRARLQRALLACTVLAQGTPMLCAGDELGRTQGGNNNAYCQDNAISWLDWAGADEALLAFSARLIALRRALNPLGERWFSGAATQSGRPDVQWLRGDGHEMQPPDWNTQHSRVLGMRLNRPHAALLWLFNASTHDTPFTLPAGPWQGLLDSSDDQADGRHEGPYLVRAHSLALLQERNN